MATVRHHNREGVASSGGLTNTQNVIQIAKDEQVCPLHRSMPDIPIYLSTFNQSTVQMRRIIQMLQLTSIKCKLARRPLSGSTAAVPLVQ